MSEKTKIVKLEDVRYKVILDGSDVENVFIERVKDSGVFEKMTFSENKSLVIAVYFLTAKKSGSMGYTPEPRYDDVFFDGQKWLDEL